LIGHLRKKKFWHTATQCHNHMGICEVKKNTTRGQAVSEGENKAGKVKNAKTRWFEPGNNEKVVACKYREYKK